MKVIPDHIIGEILSKRWADNAIPFLALVAVIGFFGAAIPVFFSPFSLLESTRQLGEFAIVVMGLTVVMLAGGIDLSVGSMFALSAFSAVAAFFIFHQPVAVAMGAGPVLVLEPLEVLFDPLLVLDAHVMAPR